MSDEDATARGRGPRTEEAFLFGGEWREPVCCFRARAAAAGRPALAGTAGYTKRKMKMGGRWDGGTVAGEDPETATPTVRGEACRRRTGHGAGRGTCGGRGRPLSTGRAREGKKRRPEGEAGPPPRPWRREVRSPPTDGGTPRRPPGRGHRRGGAAERETGSRGSRPGACRDRRERGPPSVDPGAEAGGRAVQSGSHERPERRPLRSAAPM